MVISEAGKDFIRGHEGLRLVAYRDGGGVLTIGYGHTGADVKPDSGWRIEQAEAALDADLQRIEACINNAVMVDLEQPQFDALCSFVFNLGCRALNNSTLLRKIKAGDMLGAALEFKKWCYDDHKIVAGLLARRIAERDMFSGTSEIKEA